MRCPEKNKDAITLNCCNSKLAASNCQGCSQRKKEIAESIQQ
jgi:hypothetical protein